MPDDAATPIENPALPPQGANDEIAAAMSEALSAPPAGPMSEALSAPPAGADDLLLSQEEMNAALGEPTDAAPEVVVKLKDETADAAAAVANEVPSSSSPAVAAANDAFEAQPLETPEFAEFDAAATPTPIDLLDDVELNVRIELGRTEMYVEDVLRLGVGSVVELDKLAGDPVDVFVNGRLIGRGEVLVLNDNFCVRINEITSPTPELEK